jgi:hypothetical protein
MSDAKPSHVESLISRLRDKGLPEIEVQSIAAQLIEEAKKADAKHACISCGRSSGSAFIEIEVAGEVVYSPPTQWVYCYREHDKPLGLCDQCFGLGQFDGFSPDEIATSEKALSGQTNPIESLDPAEGVKGA